jgi:hypothetical protein
MARVGVEVEREGESIGIIVIKKRATGASFVAIPAGRRNMPKVPANARRVEGSIRHFSFLIRKYARETVDGLMRLSWATEK